MKLTKMNELLTLVANVGVIAGIFFLAMEVQQNTDMMQAQTRDAVTSKQANYYLTIGTNEFAANLYFRGRAGEFNEMDTSQDPEASAWFFMAQANFRTWENEWYQYQKGLFEEPEFAARSANWGSTLWQFPGLRSVWNQSRRGYSSGFRNYLDQLVTDANPAQSR